MLSPLFQEVPVSSKCFGKAQKKKSVRFCPASRQDLFSKIKRLHQLSDLLSQFFGTVYLCYSKTLLGIETAVYAIV